MYYIDHYEGDLVAVADTKDNVMELITRDQIEELKKKGIRIETWESAKMLLTESMLYNCYYRLYSRLVRMTNIMDVVEYLQSHSIYAIADVSGGTAYIDFTKQIRVFDYNEVDEMFIISMYLNNGLLLLLKITRTGMIWYYLLPSGWSLQKYPIGSGVLYKNLFKKYNITLNLNDSVLYVNAYDLSLNACALVSVLDIGGFSEKTIIQHNLGRILT